MNKGLIRILILMTASAMLVLAGRSRGALAMETVQAKSGEKALTVDLAKGVKLEFAQIPAGSFTMGTTDHPLNTDASPQHPVTISKGFYMGIYEVTQAQWSTVMGKKPSAFKNCGPNCPVENVSWFDIQDFLRKLNERHDGHIYRLPTEAEWEYAARAGSKEDDISDDKLNQIAWFSQSSDGHTHPVGQRPANAWGLYDMYGNVLEWCQDWYDKDYYKSSGAVDPLGPVSGQIRVFRGGSWNEDADDCNPFFRGADQPDDRSNEVGFRLVVSLP